MRRPRSEQHLPFKYGISGWLSRFSRRKLHAKGMPPCGYQAKRRTRHDFILQRCVVATITVVGVIVVVVGVVAAVVFVAIFYKFFEC